MKNYLLIGAVVLAALAAASCQSDKPAANGGGTCRIHGTISPQYNDKQMFLVPLTGPATAETVDSVYIRDGRFEFETDTAMMAKLLIDYRYRLGLQTLLVVVEPGDVTVSIDSVSHASGTMQNDSLEKWKTVTEAHNSEFGALRKAGRQQQADSVHLVYKRFTRQMADNLREGLLHDFLQSLYPKTYHKQLPDGRTVTVDADTNEEISE